MVASTEGLDGGHVVQFYRHEEELADQVVGYLLSALRHDGVAVVIATEAHRRAFEGRLAVAQPLKLVWIAPGVTGKLADEVVPAM